MRTPDRQARAREGGHARPMARYVLEREQVMPRTRDEVFAFFADAANLERITPPFLRFSITTPLPIAMGAGAKIEYRLSLFGVPFGWRTVIASYDPPHAFVDEQERGPYAVWHHEHRFEELAGGQTKMIDRVTYAPPLGPLGAVANALFVRRTLERIFDYRRDTIAAIFPARA